MKNNELLYLEINNHLYDEKPSEYFEIAYKDPDFSNYPFIMLSKLKQTKQSPKYHPEGSVWNHTMMVIDEAAKIKYRSKAPHVFMWAALLHDIGKPTTTRYRRGKLTAYDHDKEGAILAKTFLYEFTNDANFVENVVKLIRWHMQILFVVKNMPFADIKTMKKEVDIKEVALLGFCDRLGRLNVDREKEDENIRIFLDKCGKL